MGSLSEAKKGVAQVCGDRLSSVGDYSRQRTPRCVFRGRLESPTDLQGLNSMHNLKMCTTSSCISSVLLPLDKAMTTFWLPVYVAALDMMTTRKGTF